MEKGFEKFEKYDAAKIKSTITKAGNGGTNSCLKLNESDSTKKEEILQVEKKTGKKDEIID